MNLIEHIEKELNPEYMNDVFTWQSVKEAIESYSPNPTNVPTEELVEAILIIGARRANPELTHDTALPLIKQHIKGLSSRVLSHRPKVESVSDEATLTIDKSVIVLNKALEKMVKFDDKAEKLDFILDVVNEYKKQL